MLIDLTILLVCKNASLEAKKTTTKDNPCKEKNCVKFSFSLQLSDEKY